MELVELQVADAAARAPRHGDAVTASAVRIACVQVNLRSAPGRQYDEARLKSFHFTGVAVEHVSAQAAPAWTTELVLGDQVDSDALLQ